MPAPNDPIKRKYMFTDDIKFLQKVVVFHPAEEKFLALKRSAEAFSRPNCWDLPGGNVLFGEKHLDSLIKEIKEETTLNVNGLRPVYVNTDYYPDKNLYVIFIGYKCGAINDNVRICEEHSQFGWVTKEEFLRLESANFLVDLVNASFDSK